MHKFRCHGCGKELAKGSLKYIVEVKSFADFDGYLEEYEGDVEEGISELVEAMESMDAKAMEDDVAREIVFILCKPCRDRFTNDPLQTGRPVLAGEDAKGTVH
ncbi:MAG: hypothetical protein HY894_08000 [Deltaproteobacteria bacterium]|nr:hypothetical protein [Deltaproteobacteria bacterium]